MSIFLYDDCLLCEMTLAGNVWMLVFTDPPRLTCITPTAINKELSSTEELNFDSDTGWKAAMATFCLVVSFIKYRCQNGLTLVLDEARGGWCADLMGKWSRPKCWTTPFTVVEKDFRYCKRDRMACEWRMLLWHSYFEWIGHLDNLNAILRCTTCVLLLSVFKLNGSVSSLFVTNDTVGQGCSWLTCINGTSQNHAMIVHRKNLILGRFPTRTFTLKNLYQMGI